jgi:hypothetical protein
MWTNTAPPTLALQEELLNSAASPSLEKIFLAQAV